ncbi:KdsC family phosphatase [Priestia megaterium]|uniref:KdsC family phosphatase n=1 Tax=Priestia megaterium TaxID=1404 RepID=UPI001FB1AC49|nr:HAD hydrolase family protein [Priestia megaterium]
MKKIKLIVLDVDGVLTDGSLYIGSNQVEYKRFNTQDGMGITLAHYAGLKTAIITGRKSEAVTKRAAELKINYVYQGISNKLEVLSELLIELGLTVDEICYMGDDINDLPILKTVGISFAPDNAVELVKESVDNVTKHSGGNGAVREMIEVILQQQTNFEELVHEFIYGKNKVIQ